MNWTRLSTARIAMPRRDWSDDPSGACWRDAAFAYGSALIRSSPSVLALVSSRRRTGETEGDSYAAAPAMAELGEVERDLLDFANDLEELAS